MTLGPEFNILVKSMVADDPAERPTASEALVRIREIHARAAPDALAGSVPGSGYEGSAVQEQRFLESD